MLEMTAELAGFFDVSDFDAAVFDKYADLAYASARDRERFEAILNEHLDRSGSGTIHVALGLLILGKFSESLESFAKAGRGKVRYFYEAQAALALGRYELAVKCFEAAADAGWDAFECDMQAAAALIRAADLGAAEKLVKKHERIGADRADWYYVKGFLAERSDQRAAAIENYEKTLTLSPEHEAAMFRAAWLFDLRGDDERAIELYRVLAERPRAHVNALINLAVIYEDCGDFADAAACLRRVLAAYPNHARACLFLKDVESSRQMVIDESIEERAETRNRLLETPISEFELSVRARNCLKKMQIHTLGDLLKLNEAELLSYKNFGETSLNEIKGLLTKRGLRLGQRPDEIDATVVAQAVPQPKVTVPPGSEGMLHKPVSELELSVRARRCLQRLGISTIGDLIQRSEPELLATRNFGLTSLSEIKGRLTELGLSLAPKQ